MGFAAAITALETPRFVFVDDASAFVASGVADVVEGGFDVVDALFAGDDEWCVRADFAGRVTAWRPRVSRRQRRPRTLPLPDVGGDAFVVVGDDDAARAAYEGRVAAAVAAIRAGVAEKIVVARQLRLAPPGRVDVPRFAEALLALEGSTVYVVDDGDHVFAGASPEHLLRRRGDRVEVDCVAGTRVAGDGLSLFESGKDLREHQLVVDGVVEALGAADRVVTPLRLVHRGDLCHLGSIVQATVSAPPSAQLSALHPTPATAGRPRVAAVSWLRDHEGFDRGGYGGVVGVVGKSACSLAVALRCVDVRGDEAVFTVGAGVVDGSDPAAEWQETQNKARVLWPALHAALRGDA